MLDQSRDGGDLWCGAAPCRPQWRPDEKAAHHEPRRATAWAKPPCKKKKKKKNCQSRAAVAVYLWVIAYFGWVGLTMPHRLGPRREGIGVRAKIFRWEFPPALNAAVC